MRKSTYFLLSAALAVLLSFLMAVHAAWRQQDDLDALRAKRLIVRALQLTDISLFSEARYIRHLTQADLQTPFQEHPAALEHFPSGSLVSPPFILTERYYRDLHPKAE